MKACVAPWRILVAGADAATLGLVSEWLAEAGCQVLQALENDPGAEDLAATPGFALAVVDVPFPRYGPSGLLQAVARRHPATPVLALSATLHPGVALCGEAARALGVAGVLPKPVGRDALLAAVNRLSRSA